MITIVETLKKNTLIALSKDHDRLSIPKSNSYCCTTVTCTYFTELDFDDVEPELVPLSAR